MIGTSLKMPMLSYSNQKVTNIGTGFETDFNFESIKGDSSEMIKAREIAKRFASSSANILLIGESGTGKELFAQAIHNKDRPAGPFIVLNCGAIPKNLIESELFGYDSGAFTGAKKNGNSGKFELAQGGTLFLDEIGDMPIESQAVLLRVLENKQVMRIGGKEYKTVDFRLVAATNKNLKFLVENGQFREDLYYRLSVLEVTIPPLRQRETDIITLAELFVRKHCSNRRSRIPEISKDAKVKLMQYCWPGNVRQLENVMIYAVNMLDTNVILPRHLPDEIIKNKIRQQEEKNSCSVGMQKTNDVISIKEAEKNAIENALIRLGNDKVLAAEVLGISVSTLYRKLKIFGIQA
jgi:transcriptional regulator with PAS, ATPase and Fis domain